MMINIIFISHFLNKLTFGFKIDLNSNLKIVSETYKFHASKKKNVPSDLSKSSHTTVNL